MFKNQKKYLAVTFNLEPEVWRYVQKIARRNERKGADQLRFIIKDWLSRTLEMEG
jgi:hypothetical protein